MNLSKTGYEILARVLHLAAEEFSNHGCNDFSVPNTAEARKFMIGAEEWSNPDDYKEYGLFLSEDESEIETQDSTLMSYFASLAEEAAEKLSENA